ncbi:MAG: hypothetical protein QF501_04315 [Anaerolineales bacterium]|nr:hypothetical protein [Anaerolineales bacterium]
MQKVAIVILSQPGSPERTRRMVNALQAAREFKEAGDDIKLIFDGGGTQWIREFAQGESKCAGLFAAVEDCAAACSH